MKLEDPLVCCKDWMCDSGQRSLDCYGGKERGCWCGRASIYRVSGARRPVKERQIKESVEMVEVVVWRFGWYAGERATYPPPCMGNIKNPSPPLSLMTDGMGR